MRADGALLRIPYPRRPHARRRPPPPAATAPPAAAIRGCSRAPSPASRARPRPASWVRVLSAEGETLGYGDYSPRSQIRVRLLAFGKDAPPTDWLAERLAAASRAARPTRCSATPTRVRLVNAEGDGLPGLVVDRYADVVVRARVDRRHGGAPRASSRRSLAALAGRARGRRARRRRPPRAARASRPRGALWGALRRGPVAIAEHGRRYDVDVLRGQKTGFYLDQRDARDLVEALAAGRRVLDLFAYTGGFAVAAARGGAAARDAGRLVGGRARAGARARRAQPPRARSPRASCATTPSSSCARRRDPSTSWSSIRRRSRAARADVDARRARLQGRAALRARARGARRARARLLVLAPRGARAVPQDRLRRLARRGPPACRCCASSARRPTTRSRSTIPRAAT